MSERWYAQHRQEWIAETVRVFGFINREHIERKFGISTPQASLDLRAFQEKNPATLEYNTATKRYERAEKLAQARKAVVAYNDLIEQLQGLCDDFGCLGGENRINWLRSRLEQIRNLESTTPVSLQESGAQHE